MNGNGDTSSVTVDKDDIGKLKNIEKRIGRIKNMHSFIFPVKKKLKRELDYEFAEKRLIT